MIVLWIVLAILAVLALLLLFGSAKIRVICREKLLVSASVCGIRFSILSDKEKKEAETDFKKCKNPDAVLKKELRRQKKAAKKAARKQKKAAKRVQQHQDAKTANLPTPNLKENLDMILHLLKKLYQQTKGKVNIRVRKMHIRVGTEDAAKTAILYGVILQSASYLLNFIETHFTHIKRCKGDMQITADYLSGQCSADIDITCSLKIRRIIRMALVMLSAYTKEKRIARRRAELRVKGNEKLQSDEKII